jgi:hypothetical protein
MFKLPSSTIVDKIVPKSSFDEYATTKQKKLLSSVVARIKWLNKISTQTVNLQGKEVNEIQVFELELKEKSNVNELLLLINKVIPYQILFVLRFNEEIMYSISKKHTHPTNENQAVVDWTFSTSWKNVVEDEFEISLSNSLDSVFQEICFKISGKNQGKEKDIETLIAKEQQLKQLNYSIEKITASIDKCKQFNKKVELNRQLKEMLNKKIEIDFDN